MQHAFYDQVCLWMLSMIKSVDEYFLWSSLFMNAFYDQVCLWMLSMILVTFCIGEHSKNKLIDKFLASQFICLEIKYTTNLTCVLTERKVEKENQQGKKERTGMIHMILNKMTQRVKKVGLFIAHMLKELFIVSPETLRQYSSRLPSIKDGTCYLK